MVYYLIVGEIRPDLPERELPVEDFGFVVAVPLFGADLSLMTREELTGFVEDGLPEAEAWTSGEAPSYDIPYPSGTQDPPFC